MLTNDDNLSYVSKVISEHYYINTCNSVSSVLLATHIISDPVFSSTTNKWSLHCISKQRANC